MSPVTPEVGVTIPLFGDVRVVQGLGAQVGAVPENVPSDWQARVAEPLSM